MDDDLDYPADRLAELLAAVDGASRSAGTAADAPPALVEALRASALAFFLELPEPEQVEIFGCLTEAERDGLLPGLPLELKERLLGSPAPGIGIAL